MAEPILTAQQRQQMLGPTGEGIPNSVSGAEQRVFTDQANVQNQQNRLVDLTQQFFNDPARGAEREAQVGTFRELGTAQAIEAARQREQEARFARARGGNVGGSAEANQIGNIQNALASDVIGVESQAGQLDSQLRAQQIMDETAQVMQAMAPNPFIQQALQAELRGLGDAAQALQVAQQDRDRLRGIQEFADDEFSRVLGNFVNRGTQSVVHGLTNQERLRQIKKDNEFQGGGGL